MDAAANRNAFPMQNSRGSDFMKSKPEPSTPKTLELGLSEPSSRAAVHRLACFTRRPGRVRSLGCKAGDSCRRLAGPARSAGPARDPPMLSGRAGTGAVSQRTGRSAAPRCTGETARDASAPRPLMAGAAETRAQWTERRPRVPHARVGFIIVF